MGSAEAAGEAAVAVAVVGLAGAAVAVVGTADVVVGAVVGLAEGAAACPSPE